ncbi:pilin glycosyl transferase A [Neisseria gonorrhoeae]|uniref:Pilin glycosyl transferase A n=1 Tax=Neisseria gonorrhoeae TaxID=485 RepID=A0A379B0T3_NEIGO|nr:pilin glycosyl transferase A [Neisseria gonorrhoeae]
MQGNGRRQGQRLPDRTLESRILAEKMIYFIENRAAVRLMGNASYAIAKDKFDAEKVDLKFLDILKA